MKSPLLTFGAGDIAQFAQYYFTSDSDYEVVAFTADRAYVRGPTFCGRPLVPFDDVVATYPLTQVSAFVATYGAAITLAITPPLAVILSWLRMWSFRAA